MFIVNITSAYIKAREKKSKTMPDKKELELLSKSELIRRILQLESKNRQLLATLNNVSEDRIIDENKYRAGKPFDFTRCHKRKILLKFYYLGWEYNGFVTQEDTEDTVERHLFTALRKSCCIQSRESSSYHRCGRTDKGVSSFSQVISIEVRSKLSPENQHRLTEELRYCKILNRLLPSNIRCIAWHPIPNDFSARFDCKSRTYRYFFPRGNLDISAMDTAIKYAIGDHDFRNICKMDVANGVMNFKRTISDAKVFVSRKNTDRKIGYDMCELVITSRAFLWHQIRCLMSVLFLVGYGKEKPEVIEELLNVDRNPRKPQYDLAHEIPLNLWHCEYEKDQWHIDEEELVYTIKTLQRDWTLNTIKSYMIENMLTELEKLANRVPLNFQSDSLLLGVQSKVYRPLMQRVTCDSLESKIQRYKRKRRLEIAPMDDN